MWCMSCTKAWAGATSTSGLAGSKRMLARKQPRSRSSTTGCQWQLGCMRWLPLMLLLLFTLIHVCTILSHHFIIALVCVHACYRDTHASTRCCAACVASSRMQMGCATSLVRSVIFQHASHCMPMPEASIHLFSCPTCTHAVCRV